MNLEQAKQFVTKHGAAPTICILNAAPKDAVYVVDVIDPMTRKHTWYVNDPDQAVSDVKNEKYPCLKLEDLRKAIMWDKE